MLQQQIMDQYAIINNLVATSKLTDNPNQDLKAKQNEFLYAEAKRNSGSTVNSGSMHPAFAQQVFSYYKLFFLLVFNERLVRVSLREKTPTL